MHKSTDEIHMVWLILPNKLIMLMLRVGKYRKEICLLFLVVLTIRSAAEAGATSTCEPRRYSLLFHYEKIVYMSMKQKTVQ